MLHHQTVSNLMQGFNRILFNTETSCFSSKPCTMSRNIHAYQKCFSRGGSLLFNLDAVVAITNVKTNQIPIGILRKEHILLVSLKQFLIVSAAN